MTKKEIKEVLKKHNYTMITKSFYDGDDTTSCLFNAYDDLGSCYRFFVDTLTEYANVQRLSDISIHDKRDVSYMFFN